MLIVTAALAAAAAAFLPCPPTHQEIHAVFADGLCSAAPADAQDIVAGCALAELDCAADPEAPPTFAVDHRDEARVTYGEVLAFSVPAACVPEGYDVVEGLDCAEFACAAGEPCSCLANERTLLGTPMCTAGAEAMGESALGCIPADTQCLKMLTTVRSRVTGRVFQLLEGCVPDGYEVVQETLEPVLATPEGAFCAPGGAAETPAVSVGCNPVGTFCIAAVLFVEDAAGAEYVIPSGCMPSYGAPLELQASQQCGAADDDEEDDEEDEDDNVPAPGACGMGMRPAEATPLESFCSEDMNAAYQQVGCVSTSAMCMMQVTFAHNANGEHFVFQDGCLPAEFTADEEQVCPPKATVCQLDQMPVFGVALEVHCDDAAAEVTTVIGCVPSGTMCVQTVTHVEDHSGHVFVIQNGCIPIGFTESDKTCDDLPGSDDGGDGHAADDERTAIIAGTVFVVAAIGGGIGLLRFKKKKAAPSRYNKMGGEGDEVGVETSE